MSTALALLQALPSSMIEPRQSTTVPNVSKTSAIGITAGLASANAGTNSTAAPTLKSFKISLRFMVSRIIKLLTSMRLEARSQKPEDHGQQFWLLASGFLTHFFCHGLLV